MKAKRTIVVPVIGIPGSGKSTCCRLLQSWAQQHKDTHSIDTLCYDDLFDSYAVEDMEASRKSVSDIDIECKTKRPEVKAVKHTSAPGTSTQCTDDGRNLLAGNDPDAKPLQKESQLRNSKLAAGVETHAHEQEIESTVDSDYLLKWRERRQKAVQRLRSMLLEDEGQGGDSQLRMILIDDNFYYRSMRKEIYQLSDMMDLGYVQLWIVCDTDEAIRRDAQRTGKARVGTEVIQRMKHRFDSPDPDEHAWETHTVQINTTDWTKMSQSLHSDSVNDYDLLDSPGTSDPRMHLAEAIMDKLTKHAMEALKEPSRYAMAQKQAEDRRAAQMQTQKNTLHQLDLKLKAVASEKIRQFRMAPLQAIPIKTFSKKVSDDRKLVLALARTELISVAAKLPSFDSFSLEVDSTRDAPLISEPAQDVDESGEDFIARWCDHYNKL